MNFKKYTTISLRLFPALILGAMVISSPAQSSIDDSTGPAPVKHHGWFSRVFMHGPNDVASASAATPGSGFMAHVVYQQPVQQSVSPAPQPSQAAPLPPQQSAPAPAPQDDTYVLKATVNEVDLFFTVTDKKGRFVTGLQQQNFGLLDDGRPPIRVVRFQQQTQLPLRVGVMLDTSSSIRERFQFEQDAATDFFLQVLHRNDRAFVEGFDVQINLAQDFTNNVDLLDTGVRKLRPGGGTALYDSLYTTCKNQMLTLQEEGVVRKAIVLVSDGVDNYSRATQEDAIKMCQRAETIVYTISTDTSPSKGAGGAALQKIAEATGGQAFFPDRLEDVSRGFKSIEEELRSQYSLLYTPAEFKQDGSFRTIYLQATDSRYHVRAKKGYFAPRPPQ